MADIHALKPSKPQPVAGVVELLDALLTLARDGEICEVAVVYASPRGEVERDATAIQLGYAVLGAMRVLADQISEAIREDEDTE